MSGAGPWLPGSISSGATALKERLADLELALEDKGWTKLIANSTNEFSRWGIVTIICLCRLYFIKNPLVRRGIMTISQYVCGRGVNIAASDEASNQVLQDFLSDPRNAHEIGALGLAKKIQTEYTDGNIFFAFFADASGKVVLRTIDATEIDQVVTDPDDASVPRYYHRRWMQQQFDAQSGVVRTQAMEGWYVALGYTPRAGIDVQTDDTGQPVPVYHAKFGGLPKWTYGCPLAYPALDYARAYKELLENWCSIQRALARFAWQVKTEGGAPAIAAFRKKLETTLGSGADLQGVDTNPPPVTGSSFITGPGNELSPIKTAGVQTPLESGRRVLLMVAAAFGLPETFFGDASVGTLATAKSLDRPTELLCKQVQEEWREILQIICRYVLERARTTPGGSLREAVTDPNTVTISVEFPDILEHDGASRIQQIVSSMTLDGKQVNGIDERIGIGLLLTELGVEDVRTVLESMYPEAEYKDRMDRLNQEPAQQPATSPAAVEARRQAVLSRAVRALEAAAKRMEEAA